METLKVDVIRSCPEGCVIVRHLQVSEVVTEVLGQKDPSPPAGSGKTMLANAVDTRTRTSRTTRIRGSSGFVRMQVRREVMSEPQYPRILYTISDTVSKEEAFLHDDT